MNVRGEAVKRRATLVVAAFALAAPATARASAPLQGEWLEPLPDGAGFVSPPTGATTRRPIVVAVHGAGDRPDWSCSEWRAIFGPVPFVVCPRGAPVGDARTTFAWSSVAHLEGAIERAIAATSARYAEHVALDAPRVYAGFSQGAMLGAQVVARAPDRYPFVVFLEGLGDDSALARAARRDAAPVAPRILLACSQRGCAASRAAASARLGRAGVASRVVDAGPVGHVVDGRVIAALRKEVPWLLGDDAWWRDTRAAVE